MNAPTNPSHNLTREETAQRAQQISTRRYDVTVDVTGDGDTFRTATIANFTATPGTNTWIDFLGRSVESLHINGEQREIEWDGARLQLRDLAAENTVKITAIGEYMHSGEGLHRMVDPVDGEVYLYSQFEVPDSRRMYPVFEQPDLKAIFGFTITAPARWKVFSNEPTPPPVPAQGTWTNTHGEEEPIATWNFADTKRMSSYITALVAGPYVGTTDQVDTRTGKIDLGVYCRASLWEYLDYEEFLSVTKAGFGFFEELFDYPYPFTKYDQIFTPEYNWGAMENIGCVTFTEKYIFRSQVPAAIRERRALTNLHELAHMWFGNLVTMQWWNDLWLNESFAEWASSTAQAEATKWSDAWTTFAIAEKGWAYRQDQLSSTHPIAANIRHFEDVQANFDGITYAKGASVLKQLVAYVGREPFVQGLRRYFPKHAYANTTLSDLLVELETASGRDLKSWTKKWLETAGVNTLTPVLEHDENGIITAAAVQQTASSEHPTLRPHRIVIGCYQLANGSSRRTKRIEIDIAGPLTSIPELIGEKQPDLLLLNDEDLTYAKIRLDDTSRKNVLKNPTALDKSLPRALVLGAAWDMTRDGEMSSAHYLSLALTMLKEIDDSNLIRLLLGQIATAATMYTPVEKRESTREYVSSVLQSIAENMPAGSDGQLQVVTAYADFTRRPEDATAFSDWLSGNNTLPGLTVDVDMRWTLLIALCRLGAAGETEIAAELERDKSSKGKQRAMTARAAQPTPAAKQAAWESIMNADELSNEELAATAMGFNQGAENLRTPYIAKYHAEIEQYWDNRPAALASDAAELLYPASIASAELLTATQDWLDAHPTAAPALRRAVAEHRDDQTRAHKAQSVS